MARGNEKGLGKRAKLREGRECGWSCEEHLTLKRKRQGNGKSKSTVYQRGRGPLTGRVKESSEKKKKRKNGGERKGRRKNSC